VHIPSRINGCFFIDREAHVLTKMLSPGGYNKFQSEDTGPLETLVEPAVERAISPKCSLDLLHQNLKALAILVCY
jgi:hypothetical protein